MIGIVARLRRIPEDERAHVARLTKSALSDALMEVLDDDKENPIFKTKLASILHRRIRDIDEACPEADDNMPMRIIERFEVAS